MKEKCRKIKDRNKRMRNACSEPTQFQERGDKIRYLSFLASKGKGEICSVASCIMFLR